MPRGQHPPFGPFPVLPNILSGRNLLGVREFIMSFTVTRSEFHDIASGKFVGVALNVPHLELMRAAPTSPSVRVSGKRGRRVHGKRIPLETIALIVRVVPPNGAPFEASSRIGFVHPLDADAIMTISVDDPELVPVGSSVELLRYETVPVDQSAR